MPSQFGGVPVEQTGSKFGGVPVDSGTQASQPSQPRVTISADEPTGIADRVARWTQNVMDDIRHGTDITGVGAVLKGLGAHGLEYGEPKAVGEFMGSLPLGVLKAGKGAAELAQGKLLQGGEDVLSGGAQALEMPLMVAAPESVTRAASGAVTGAKAAAGAVDRFIPNAGRAGEAFSDVMGAARDIPVDVTGPGNTALNIQKLSESGASRPKVIGDFLKRVTDPEKGPLTYEEARNFYSNATRLSSGEAQKLTPIMKRQVAQFTADLNSAIEQAAEHAGKLDQYQSAMEEYHKAMRLRAISEGVKEILKDKAVQAAGAGAVGALAVKEFSK